MQRQFQVRSARRAALRAIAAASNNLYVCPALSMFKQVASLPTIALIVLSLVAAVITQARMRTIDDRVLKNAGLNGQEWLTYGLTLSETRFSPLTQLNATNIQQLGLVWS